MARIANATCPFCDATIENIDFTEWEARCLGCGTVFEFEPRTNRFVKGINAKELWLHRNVKVKYE